MAPMLPEAGVSPSSRRAFTTSCSPDELLGEIIQTLYPKYCIDAPHLLALRKVLSSAIVAPKKPPRLMRTRPDKRIGQIGSIYDTSQHSVHGPNGPPVSTNASFYFHHKDPDFEKLLPQVDRSRYVSSDKPVGEESQDSTETISLVIPNPISNRAASRSSGSPAASASAVQEVSAMPTRSPMETSQSSGHTHSSGLVSDPPGAHDIVRKSPASSLAHRRPTPIPTITITSADSEKLRTTKGDKDLSVPSSSLQAADVFVEVPDTQSTNNSTQSIPLATSYSPHLLHTQDTNNTQQSEVFSPPVELLQCTPPTQEESQSGALSQTDANDTIDLSATKKMEDGEHQQPLVQCGISPQSSSSHAPALGKRSRDTLEGLHDKPLKKRSKTPWKAQ